MDKRCLLSFLFITFITITSNAQSYLGVATGSNSQINSMYLNPANIVGGPDKIEISIMAFNIGVDNNLGTFTKIGNLSKGLNNNDSGSSNAQSVFSNSGRSNFSMMLPMVDIRGPGIIFSIDKKNSIAITTAVRVMDQFNNFNQSLYNTVTNTGSITNTNYSYSSQKFNWTADMWNEIGLSYGRVIIDKPESELKVGVTIRRLGGIGYIGLKGNNLDVNYSSGADSFYASHSDIEFASNIVSNQSAVFNGINSSNLLSRLFGATDGTGVGGDIGVIYGHVFGSSDPAAGDKAGSAGEHKLVLSAAVRDIGSINYNKSSNASIDVSGNGYLTGTGLANNVGNYTSFESYMKQQGFTADTSAAATRLYMPTTLVLSADYQIHDRFYVNASYIGNLANRQDFGNSYYSQVSVIPRYDYHLFSVAVPITYSWLAQDIKMGVGIRFSGFFIGSDDMLALFSSHQYGFDIYMGGYVPIKFKKKKRLEDHDHYERWVQ